MSSSEAFARPLLVLVLAVLLGSLAACSSIRPLYGTDAVAPGLYAFHYADPAGRLDQVIYSELRLRLGPDASASDALLVRVSTTSAARAITRTGTVKPAATSQMVVTASFTVTDPAGAVVASGTRSTTATYTTVGQVLGDTEGQNEAAERGARALADTIRLAILGALARTQ